MDDYTYAPVLDASGNETDQKQWQGAIEGREAIVQTEPVRDRDGNPTDRVTVVVQFADNGDQRRFVGGSPEHLALVRSVAGASEAAPHPDHDSAPATATAPAEAPAPPVEPPTPPAAPPAPPANPSPWSNPAAPGGQA